MIHPIALLCLLLRMMRAAQGIHASPDGYARGLSGELRRHRSRRVRRYAEPPPFRGVEDGAAEETEPYRVPAPRPPADAAPYADTASPTESAQIQHVAGTSAHHGAAISETDASTPAASVAVPAAIVRGRCFMTGRDTGARPAESRNLALTVLCALADQGQASTRAYGRTPGEGFALGQSSFLESPILPRQGIFAGPFRPIGAFCRTEPAEPAERAVLAGGEAA